MGRWWSCEINTFQSIEPLKNFILRGGILSSQEILNGTNSFLIPSKEFHIFCSMRSGSSLSAFQILLSLEFNWRIWVYISLNSAFVSFCLVCSRLDEITVLKNLSTSLVNLLFSSSIISVMSFCRFQDFSSEEFLIEKSVLGLRNQEELLCKNMLCFWLIFAQELFFCKLFQSLSSRYE